MTDRPYILLLEDDFLFTEETKIEKLYELMKVSDIAGGGVYNRFGNRLEFEFNFKENGDTLEQINDGNFYELHNPSYKPTQCILNFFLAKRIVFDKILWYNKLKLAEHQHFFYRLSRQTDFKVVFTPDVKITDNKERSKETKDYQNLRAREKFFSISIKDLGFKKLKYLSGRVAEAVDDNIKYHL